MTAARGKVATPPSRGKILLIAPTLEGGGSDRVLLNVAEYFSDLDYTVHVVVVKNLIEFPVDKRIRLTVLDLPPLCTKHKLVQHLLLAIFFRYYLRKYGPFSLVLSNYQSRYDFLPKPYLKKLHFWIHADYWSDVERLMDQAPRKAHRENQRIIQFYSHRQLIAVSEAAKQSLLENNKVCPARCEVIYNPFDFEKIRAAAREDNPAIPAEPYIIHVAKFDRYKRHDLLFAAMRMVTESVKLVLLVKESEPLRDMIDQYGLQDRVLVAGFQRNPYPWIKQAKLLVLSSDAREALPTVLIEALICGTPVVSTDCPNGPREILTGPLARWLVPVNNAEALGRKIQEALECGVVPDGSCIEKFRSETVMRQFIALIDRGTMA